MALAYIKETGKGSKLGLWHITEPVDELLKIRPVSEEENRVMRAFTYDKRKQEWLVSKILAGKIIGRNIPIVYDENNKPFLKDADEHISISHSHGLLAVIVAPHETGIDIELLKPNVVRIRDKFMSDKEMKEAGADNQIETLTLYWCAKESLYKYYGKKNLVFRDDMRVEPFNYAEKGKIIAHIDHPSMQKKLELEYEKLPASGKEYMMAWIVNEY